VDRYDVGEFVGLLLLVMFGAVTWWPSAILLASVALLVEVNLRSRGGAPVRESGQPSRAAAAARAARAAWRRPGAPVPPPPRPRPVANPHSAAR
jgi:hypothetical protein